MSILKTEKMQVKTIIQEIQQLSLRKRFLIIEETLKSIKKEELKISAHNDIFDDSNDANSVLSTLSINEKSLAKDWLSEEDDRWDKLL